MDRTQLFPHRSINLQDSQLKQDTNSQLPNHSNIIIHEYYTEQPFSPPPKNIKQPIKIRNTKKFAEDPLNKSMVSELTDLIPELSGEIKNMNQEQFMETYTLAMSEKKKSDQFKSKQRMGKQPSYQKNIAAKAKVMQNQILKPSQRVKNTFQTPFGQPEHTMKRSYDVMISNNPPKLKKDRQMLPNQRLAKTSKIQPINVPNQMQPSPKTLKMPRKLTREVRRNESDEDFDIEEHSIGYKRLHQENNNFEIYKKTRLQQGPKDFQTSTNSKEGKESCKRDIRE